MLPKNFLHSIIKYRKGEIMQQIKNNTKFYNTTFEVVKIQTLKEFLNSLETEKVVTNSEELEYTVFVLQTPAIEFPIQDLGQSNITRRSISITNLKSFKEIKEDFFKYLTSENRENVIFYKSSSDFENSIKDAVVKLTENMIFSPYVLFKVNPNTWCLTSAKKWKIVLKVDKSKQKPLGKRVVDLGMNSYVLIKKAPKT
jgi:hypothetical protein